VINDDSSNDLFKNHVRSTIPDPASRLEFAIRFFSPYIKDECLILDYVGFASE
jgi:hypothetical protein